MEEITKGPVEEEGRRMGGGGGVQSGGDAEFFGSEAVSHKPCLSSCHGDVMISK